ncbi:hypothetical protein CP8484711_0535B, partial [Chlamydia psittaci 84-8471/1]
INWLF